jgi:predicted peptidase
MKNFIRSALSPFVLLATLWICHANTPVDGFRERIFKNERGETMPYRLFVPSNYDAKKKYPIVLWLHGGGGRGNDNLKQISGGTKTAIWPFHGAEDRAISVERSRRMIAVIRKAGGNPRYTEYADVGHNSWERAFKEPRLLDWVFGQKSKEQQ